MEHSEFVDELERRLGSRRAAVEGLGAFVEAVTAEVAAGGKVALTGFGVFDSTRDRSGDAVPRFHAGAAFKDFVRAPEFLPGQGSMRATRDPEEEVGRERPPKAITLERKRESTRAAGGAADTLRFRHFRVPAEVSLSAVLPLDTPRCGIYVLHFDDGHRYVGQTRDVLVRFATHRRRWRDRIVAVEFAPAEPGQLNDLERRTLQRLEHDGIGLYNSALVGLPMGDSPLDLVVDRVEQERWLDGGAEAAYDLDARLSLAGSRPRSGGKFRQLASREDYQGIRAALLVYLMDVVPWPHETERRFWSITSMPSTKRSSSHRRLSAISVNNVETLVFNEVLDDEGWFAGGFINVAPGVAESHGWLMQRHTYRTVGEVDTIGFGGWEGLLDLVDKPDVLDAARRTALGLMRKGRGMMAKYHDDSLADDVFDVLTEVGGDDHTIS